MSTGAHDCPLPKRSSVAAEESTSGVVKRKKKFTPLVLAGVGLGLVAIPLAGFAATHSGQGSAGQGGESVAQAAPVSSDLWQGSEASIVNADGLHLNQGAASRAKYRDPIEVSACVTVDAPSDGARTMTQRDSLYYPMLPGTYEITSTFSWRVSPISGEAMAHEGDDYAGADGTPFYAVADGTVKSVSSNDHSGGMTVIEHHLPDGTRYESAYLHQWPETIPVTVGQQVKAGQQIGTVGSAGWSTGPHLHFEIHDASGTPVDPGAWMAQHGASNIGTDC